MKKPDANNFVKLLIANLTSFLKYLDLSQARATRIQYLVIPPLYLMVMLVAMVITSRVEMLALAIFIVGGITVVINVIRLKIKRLHDINFGGWWLILFAIPIINLILELCLLCIRGTRGKNKFGQELEQANKMEYILAGIFIPVRILIFFMPLASYKAKLPVFLQDFLCKLFVQNLSCIY